MEEIRKETLLYEIECALEKVKEEKAKLIAADKNAEVPKAVNDRISSLVLIKSELIRENKKHHKDYELTKEEEIVELSRMAGAREQNVKDYKNNGRLDLAEADANELAIIKEFINNMIDTYLSEQAEGYKPSMRDMGKIKSLVNATYPSVSGNIIKDVLMGRINGNSK